MTDQLVAIQDHAGVPAPTAVHLTKIAVVIRDDLPVWQKLNMTAFLASGVALSSPDAMAATTPTRTGRVTRRCSASR